MSSSTSPEDCRSPDDALPDGWVLCESKSLPGRKYYFDRRTGSSLWTKPPPEPDKTPQNKTRKCKKHTDQPSPSKATYREEVAHKVNSHRVDTDQKSNLKRKSDPSSNSSSKRSRHDPSGSDYQHPETPGSSASVTSQHSRSTPSSSKDIIPKHGSGKNAACKRMDNLRSQLHKEDDPMQSPSPRGSASGADTPKPHHYDSHRRSQEFRSPKPEHAGRDSHRYSPSDRQAQGREQKAINNYHNKQYIPKNSSKDAHSPEFTSSSTAQGSNDSLEMISSPSQFFEANKIICSLKAQLPEEREGREERREPGVFAVIEEGINAHTIEYSAKNHPATPPHFAQATKIVSSIKSRLMENISDCERKPRFRSPANDRLTALRTAAQPPADSVKCNNNVQNEVQASPKPVLFENKCNVSTKPVENAQLHIAHNPVLNLNRQKSEDRMEVENVREIRERRNSDNHSSGTAPPEAQPADSAVVVVDTNIFIHDLPFIKTVLESYIIGYKEKPTLLVPWQVINELDRLKDNNNGNQSLCSKAKIATDYLYQVLPNNHRVKGQTLRDAGSHIYPCELPDDDILNCCLQQSQRGNAVILLSNDKNLCTRATINSVRALGVRELREALRAGAERGGGGGCGGEPRARLQHYEDVLCQLLANILENEMRARYDTLWQHVLLKAPPWSLLDALQCLLKHWLAVFSEVFPRVEPLLQRLRQLLARIHDRAARVTSSDVSSFRELALELAGKCQIIPDYLEAARRACELLAAPSPPPVDDEKTVVDAFEAIWTAFSSYCARMATILGVNHQLDDRRENRESAESLRNKWPEFTNHIQAMAYALKRTLTANENSGIEPLHSTMSECLAFIGGDSNSIDNDSLRTFCLNNRNLIHEALVKFTQLTELLTHCRSAFSS